MTVLFNEIQEVHLIRIIEGDLKYTGINFSGCLDAEGTFECSVVIKAAVNATFQIHSVTRSYVECENIRRSGRRGLFQTFTTSFVRCKAGNVPKRGKRKFDG